MTDRPANGDRLGPWVIVRPALHDTVARVYVAHHVDDPDRTVIVKVLPPRADAEQRQRHRQEIEALAHLQHPGLVRLLDHGTEGDVAYLVMERAHGHPLSALCTRPVDQALALSIVRQLADALAHAHHAGVCHRDVKPDNVIVDQAGHVVLTDFGIATGPGASRLTLHAAHSPGTPAYAPPEWFEGPLDDGAPADVYGLGGLLWELSTGRSPGEGKGRDALHARRRRDPLSLTAPPRAAELVRRLTEPEAGRRPTAAEIARELADVPVQPLVAAATLPGAADTLDVPDEPLVPQRGHRTIGRYEIVQELGRGGMGVVYRAFDPVLQRDVALKATTPLGARATGRARVRREARAVARLRHPGIVQVLDVGPHDGGLYLAMELVEGRDLAAILADEGPLPIRMALSLAVEVGDALAHAHQRGIVHRDVKPGNIFVDEEGGARLGDFGVALSLTRDAVRETAHGQLLGTPMYMAPEQARGDRAAVGPRTDVYALGAVLYELVTGRPPFLGEHPAQVLHAILHDEPPALRTLRPGASSELANVCRKAMEPDPAHRYPSMRSLVADLRRLQRGQPIVGAPNTLRRRVAWWLHRYRAPLRIAAATVAGAALVVGLVALGQQAVAQRAEQRAAARLDALRHTIAEHLREARPAEAEAAFRAFLDVRENLGTAALAQAWRDRADRDLAEGRPAEARRALAHAYAEATSPTQQTDALLALMASQAQDWRWADLRATWEVLRERFPEGAPPAEAAALTWRLAIAERRFPRPDPALDETTRALEPLVAALRAGHRLPEGAPFHTDDWPSLFPWDRDDDQVPELVWATSEGLRTFAPGLPLAVVDTLPWPAGVDAQRALPLEVDERPFLLVPMKADLALVAVEDGQLATMGHWPMPGAHLTVFAAGAADLDRDGRDEVFVGSYHRRLFRLDRSGGRWSLSEAGGSTNHTNSEIRGIIATDLDEDGHDDLAVAASAWGAYDLRVLAQAPDGLGLVAREQLGHLGSAVLLQGLQGPEVLVSRVHSLPEEDASATSVPAAGLFRFRLHGGQLERLQHVPLATIVSTGGHVPLDLDGDGREDVAVGAGADLWLGRRLADDTLAGLVVSELLPIAAYDVDGDGDDELLVRDRVDGATWLLGTGTAALPPRPTESRRHLGDPPSGWLADESRRTDDLFAMGFADEGASKLAQVAELTRDPAAASAARLRAARYLELDGHPHEALQLYDRAATAPAHAVAALQGGARCAEQLHDTEGALRRLEALEPLTSALEARTARIAELRALEGLPITEVRFDQGLAPDTFAWLDPLSVRLAPAAEALEITTAGDADVARLPLRVQGSRLSLEVQGTLEELEWAAGVTFALREPGGPDVLGFTLHGHGGAGRLDTNLHVVPGGGRPVPVGWVRPRSPEPTLGAFTIRVDWVPRLGESALEIDGLGRPLRHTFPAADAPLPAELELVVRERTDPGTAQRARVRLTRIGVRGAEARPHVPDRRGRASHAVVVGDPEAALAALPPGSPEGPEVQILALADLGRWSEAGRLLAGRATDLPDTWPRRLLRLGPAALQQPLADLWQEQAPVHFWHAWQTPARLRPDGVDVVRAFTEGPLATVPLDGVPPELAARIRLARAVAWRRLGKLALAGEVLRQAEAGLPDGRSAARAEIAVEWAHLTTLAGHPDAALQHLATALTQSLAPEVLADRLAVDPGFRSLHDHSAWHETVVTARRLRDR